MSASSRLAGELVMKSPFTSAEQETLLNLMRTHAVIAGQVERVIRGHGLSGPLYNVLRIVRGAGARGVPCSAIGARMITRVPDVTRLVDRLEREGLVARARDAEDRRIVRVTITEEGKRLAQRVARPLDRETRALFAHMAPERVRQLTELLEEARSPQAEE